MNIKRLLVMAVALAAAVAGARDIYVDGTNGNDSSADPTDPSTPYKTVNKGVTSATNGDTVHIAAGTYNEGKSWTLASAITVAGAGSSQTILKNCQFQLNHVDAVVQDLRMTGRNGNGTIQFVKNGAGGTARRCDISGNTRTTTAGTGVEMYVGNLIDCTITNNVNSGGGTGVGLYVAPSGDCLIENCLIADNSIGGAATGVGGVYVTKVSNGKNLTLRHCTIVRNVGGDAGGISLNGEVNVLMEDCLISDNLKMTAETATNTDDAYLGWTKDYTRVLKNCLIARCPTYNAGYEMENCLLNVEAGVTDPYAGGNTVGRSSAAWGGATDGSDIGCYQTDHGDGFAVSCYAVTNRGVASVTTTLVGASVNAAGEVSYEWDLDGDGTYERQGASVEATFDTVGWNSVKVKATCDAGSDAATVERVVLVAPPTTYVWTESPTPTFPYATWETAAHDPHVGIAATLRGGRLQFTNDVHMLEKPLTVARPIEFGGSGKDNNSSGNVSPLHWNLGKLPVVDAHATGTAFVRKSSDMVIARVGDGSLVHSLVMAVGRSRNCEMYGESVISNCTIRYGSFTAGSGCGILYSAGLVTHCVISNNYCSNEGTTGVQVQMSGTAKLRNSLVVGGLADNTGKGCLGAVHANGKDVVIENCTICGNTVGKGGGIYTINAVTVRNCIVRNNTALLDSDTKCICNSDGKAVIENCCLDVAAGTGCVTGDPGFIMDGKGENTWTFGTASPCVNKGAPVSWADAEPTDLFGNARVSGDVIDIGCFEADMSQATCDIAADPSTATGPTNATFSAVVTGKTLSDEAQYLWDFDGDGTFELSGKSVVRLCGEGNNSAVLKIVDNDEMIFCVTGKTDLVKIYPKVLYFSSANAAGAKFPYNTPETAAAKIGDAMDATSEGCELRVLGGLNICETDLTVGKRMTICAAPGLSERPALVRDYDDKLMTISAADAVVRGLDLLGNRPGGGRHSVPNFVLMTDGVLSDCLVSGGYYTSGSGIGLFMSGGLADRCEIFDTRGDSVENGNGNATGAAVALTGTATLRNSLVHGCWVEGLKNGKGRRAGLISVSGASATLENCTITGNTNANNAVVTTIAGGVVRNCIIYGNESGTKDNVTPASPYWPAYAPLKTVSSNGYPLDDTRAADFDYNCYTSATATAYGEHDLLADPQLVTKKGRKYVPARHSPCVDAALPLDWMTGDSLDVYGQSRKVGPKVDLGAVENQSKGFGIIVR